MTIVIKISSHSTLFKNIFRLRYMSVKMILLGPPGAGKGTQAEALSSALSIPAISTGDILRDAVKRETPIGLKAKSFMDAGGLVPDEVIIGIIIDRLSMQDCKGGYILDGVPRTIVQAEALDAQGIEIGIVLSIEISDDEIIERLSGRRTCPNCNATYHIAANPPEKDGVCDKCNAALTIRKDDERETIRNRLQVYHKETGPLKEYYKSQGKLKTVNNVPGVAEMTSAIFKALGI